MGPGGRAFVVSFLAFLVFGVIVVALRPGEDPAAQESTGGGGGASGTSGESAGEFADEDDNATASNLTESDVAGEDAGAAGDGATQTG